MRTVGSYMLIQPVKEGSTKTESGLILSDAHKEDIRYREANVYRVGSLVNGINEGDTVYYDRHAGFDMEVKGVIYKVIKEFDVVVVL
jgi:co-chaperonin GroES (HSP10)|tara:strand:+ start:889 stop:1149 length:261 start_codon:yes stop_codon:yes gene_type:complete